MAGVYLHIPFCRKACHYCDFHFSTVLKGKTELLQAMQEEIAIRKDYLSGEEVSTIYFGGGTPSLLSGDELNRLTESIMKFHNVTNTSEFTIEANPDDLTKEKMRDLLTTGVNRLSIGIQSFVDRDLQWMNRAHTGAQADYAVKLAQDSGIPNLTVDLIYGIPGMTAEVWRENLLKAIDLDVKHISAYNLTIEQGTYFGHLQKRGTIQPATQEQSEDQFLLMHELLTTAGFEHYEVSNFAKSGWRSKHNTSYWQGSKYLGVGPSAHSYDGDSRQWNVANNGVYVRSVQMCDAFFEREEIDDRIRLNEYIMTGLRTSTGIDTAYVAKTFGVDLSEKYAEQIEDLVRANRMQRIDNRLVLTTKGFLIADRVASDFFIIE
jgi:oxygen-independent coproporphyrinogen III oxidase